MNPCYPRLVPEWLAHLARRYVAWSERKIRTDLVELGIELSSAAPRRKPVDAELTVVPLSECGTEWLFRRVFNDVARRNPDFRPARWVDMVAFATSPQHDRRGIFLARVGRKYVGTCVARFRPDGMGGIYTLCVHPEYRRRGIARALLTAGLQYLKDQGAAEVRLQTHPENIPALELYLRYGFRFRLGRCGS